MANELDSFTPDWMDGKGLRGDNQDSLPDPMGPATGLPEENVFEVTTPIDDTPGNTDPGPGGGSDSELPGGVAGDILYHNGTDWVVLNKPTGMTLHPVLRYNLSTDVPYWDEPETCA